ncbi:DUF2169 domain-containing protein [Massilia sp. P8910]|uniref:DUF2169 family type VI secretion system accessory protein n=1 Tax=Massilia antarctica TaxID=2765360 RepID=UPI001E2F0D41|nr:DUF2169 domain-containing protein [Massilia antarctica]MCE3602764.1 DUF2169 domain-containing protein [Massilia antarctica]
MSTSTDIQGAMEFRNLTPFPALAFQGVDQYDHEFHVVVLRQTLTWGDEGVLTYADEQAPLCEVDEYFGTMNKSSVRQESDLCHYKPKCDVIVNATVHVPAGKMPRQCNIRLVVRRPDSEAPIPEKPRGLNPFVAPDEARLEEWRAQTERARLNPIRGSCLIDKTLVVTGERYLVSHIWPVRAVASLLRIATLGLFKVPTWRLTSALPFSQLPLRSEYAFGGECRINLGERAAKRVRKKDRLNAADAGIEMNTVSHSDDDPIALCAFEANAVGCGYAVPWFLRARRINRMSAPRIETADRPFTAAQFHSLGKENYEYAPGVLTTPSLGIRAKVHPHRRRLGGTIDKKFIEGNAALPDDFDFNVWNAAPVDQQTELLCGDEIIELINLCAPGSPGAKQDRAGNTSLRLQLPGHTGVLLMRMHNGSMFFDAMKIDTLVIEPEQRIVNVVWRAVFEKAAAIRAVDVHVHRDMEANYFNQALASHDNFACTNMSESEQRTTAKEPHG